MKHFRKHFIKSQRFLSQNNGDGGNGETEEKDTIETLQNSILIMQEQLKSLQEKNEKLNKHNQDLFLKVTAEEKPKEKIDNMKEYKDFVGTEFFEGLTTNQQKLLITILEGEDE